MTLKYNSAGTLLWSREYDSTNFYNSPTDLDLDAEGNLYVAASLRGRRGIVRISPDGSDAKLLVAGVNLIGLAFSSSGEMAVVSIDSVYSLATQIKGTLLSL